MPIRDFGYRLYHVDAFSGNEVDNYKSRSRKYDALRSLVYKSDTKIHLNRITNRTLPLL